MGRRLGQHFLTDPGILDRIVDAMQPAATDVVVEIGPGRGSLTRRLISRVGHVIAIEKDRELVEQLRAEWPGDEPKSRAGPPALVQVIAGDALKYDWHTLVRSLQVTETEPAPFKLVGNIPYAITTPLLQRALTAPVPQVIVFLIQKDVADRVTAAPGSKTYGSLSVGVQVVAHVERLFVVRAGSFQPPPMVESAVIRVTPLQSPLIEESQQPEFRRFVTGLFGQRRKQLRRSLRTLLGASKDEVEVLLAEVGVEPFARPEVLPPQELVRLFQAAGR